jgi:hypothetical protein
VNFLSWLLGKTKGPQPIEPNRAAIPTPDRPGAVEKETDNLRRWRDSGQPRQWVKSHQGSWNHDDWLALLDELKRSAFWPMLPDAVGSVLEETKNEWLQRN